MATVEVAFTSRSRFHDMKSSSPPTLIRSVSRAADLLLHVARARNGATASEAAAACHLAIPTAHHLLTTLAHEGLLSKDGPRFVLGPKAVVFADCVARQSGVPEYLLRPLRALAEE